MNGTHLAIIGGGAKAVAIASRAKVLSDLKIGKPITVTIFEKSEIGAHWTGRHGYTDGIQRLCTPIERDLGFPYDSLPNSIAEQMQQQFSWASFLVEKARIGGGEHSYSRWVDQGRKPPTHLDFHEYLKWATEKAAPNIVIGEVTKLSSTNKKWQISIKEDHSAKPFVHSQDFDGVVVTGPGPAKAVEVIGKEDRVLDGEKFWLNRQKVDRILANLKDEDNIVFIGAGGTAAAIMSALVAAGQKERPIFIVSEQPAFFTRGDSFFENRLFNDEFSWSALSQVAKNEFVNRLSRGVVWDSVMNQVSSATNVNFVYGRARHIKGSEHSAELHLKTGSGNLLAIDAGLVIDASGFNPWWWTRLIDDDYFKDNKDDEIRSDLSVIVNDQLSFKAPVWKWPNLHAPMVATSIGPGYASLLSLGRVADRVLSAYLTD